MPDVIVDGSTSSAFTSPATNLSTGTSSPPLSNSVTASPLFGTVKGEAVTEFESGGDEVPVDKLVAGEVNADEVEDASSSTVHSPSTITSGIPTHYPSKQETHRALSSNDLHHLALRATVPNKGEAVTEFESGGDEVPVDKLVAGEVNTHSLPKQTRNSSCSLLERPASPRFVP
jgi:hypothetical protein